MYIRIYRLNNQKSVFSDHFFLFWNVCRKENDKNKSTISTNDLDMFEASQLKPKSPSNTQGKMAPSDLATTALPLRDHELVRLTNHMHCWSSKGSDCGDRFYTS